MKLIDKDAIVAEIEKLKGKVDDNSSYSNGWKHSLRMVEIFLNTLEVKDVDLEKELDFVKDAYYYFTSDERSSMKKVARHFFNLGLKAREECIKNIPLLGWQTPCADPNYPCENPQMDCINCPRHSFNRYETAYQKFLYQGNPTKENNWINQLYKEKEDK